MLLLLLYTIDGLIDIIAEYLGVDWLKYVTKVLLMPLLAFYLYTSSKDVKGYKFIFLALFFSWWGDIFLMFPRNEQDPNAKLLFIAGLVSFLIGHLNYIVHFIKEVKPKVKVTVIVEKPYLVLPFLLYVFLLLKLLYPTLGSMKIPVTVYGIVITFMLMTAFNRKNLVNSKSFYLVFTGAMFFIFSDSCIAINLFCKPFELARIVIMATYVAAQLLIVKGILEVKTD